MGLNEDKNTVYLIDFGLSRSYRDEYTHQHICFRENHQIIGTVRYCSINANKGDQSRRDDLESLGYILIYFLKGSLPWQNLPNNDNINPIVNIQKCKVETSLDNLCHGIPSIIIIYIIS